MSEQKEKLSRAEAISRWLRLRKRSVWAHWFYGLFCAAVSWQWFPGGLIFLYIFERFERWNDKNEKMRKAPNYLPEGDLDWWDAFVIKIPAFALLLGLHIGGILSIRWY